MAKQILVQWGLRVSALRAPDWPYAAAYRILYDKRFAVTEELYIGFVKVVRCPQYILMFTWRIRLKRGR